MEKQEKRSKQDPRVGNGVIGEDEDEDEETGDGIRERIDGNGVDDRSSSVGAAKDSTGESPVAAEIISICKVCWAGVVDKSST